MPTGQTLLLSMSAPPAPLPLDDVSFPVTTWRLRLGPHLYNGNNYLFP